VPEESTAINGTGRFGRCRCAFGGCLLRRQAWRRIDRIVSHGENTMIEPRIIDRGRGPEIEGTRITVYTILEYLRHGHTRDWIAALLNLSSRQVQAAMDYIRDNEAAVNAEYEKIMERIRKGNPPHIQAILAESHKKLQARLAELQAAKHQAASQ
jgi:uncharacterized protein (DUF433 family)